MEKGLGIPVADRPKLTYRTKSQLILFLFFVPGTVCRLPADRLFLGIRSNTPFLIRGICCRDGRCNARAQQVQIKSAEERGF